MSVDRRGDEPEKQIDLNIEMNSFLASLIGKDDFFIKPPPEAIPTQTTEDYDPEKMAIAEAKERFKILHGQVEGRFMADKSEIIPEGERQKIEERCFTQKRVFFPEAAANSVIAISENTFNEDGTGKVLWIAHHDIKTFNGSTFVSKPFEAVIWFNGDFKVSEKRVVHGITGTFIYYSDKSKNPQQQLNKEGKAAVKFVQDVLQRYIDHS